MVVRDDGRSILPVCADRRLVCGCTGGSVALRVYSMWNSRLIGDGEAVRFAIGQDDCLRYGGMGWRARSPENGGSSTMWWHWTGTEGALTLQLQSFLHTTRQTGVGVHGPSTVSPIRRLCRCHFSSTRVVSSQSKMHSSVTSPQPQAHATTGSGKYGIPSALP